MSDLITPIPLVYGMGRRYEPDERDRAFLMREELPSEAETQMVGMRVYERGPNYNQGRTGTCVAHAWRSWMDSEPLRTRTGIAIFDLYDQCIINDQWEDNNHDPGRVFGTSVRAGAKVLAALGHVKNYLWAFTVDDVRRWMLSGQGGVVLGVNWYVGLSRPNAEGIIRVQGAHQGGHAIYCFGADDRNGLMYIQNSWGKDWGGWMHSRFPKTKIYRGCARLPYDDLNRLLGEYGEACTAVEQRVRRQGR